MKTPILIFFVIVAAAVQGQDLIVSPKGSYNCLNREFGGFSGTLPRTYWKAKDTAHFPYPWCELSNISYYGTCRSGQIEQLWFHFVFEEFLDPGRRQYIQGRFCHRLKKGLEYELGFDISVFNFLYQKSVILHCGLSDRPLEAEEIYNGAPVHHQSVRLDTLMKKDSSVSLKRKFISDGTEKYFQIWVEFPRRKKKHLYITNWHLYSGKDTVCDQNTAVRILHQNREPESMEYDTLTDTIRIFYETDRYAIVGNDSVSLLNISGRYKKYDLLSTTLIGYTDTTGSRDSNRVLSLNRARTVKNFLAENGFSPPEWEVKGVGEDHLQQVPASLNRRVEIIVRYRVLRTPDKKKD